MPRKAVLSFCHIYSGVLLTYILLFCCRRSTMGRLRCLRHKLLSNGGCVYERVYVYKPLDVICYLVCVVLLVR